MYVEKKTRVSVPPPTGNRYSEPAPWNVSAMPVYRLEPWMATPRRRRRQSRALLMAAPPSRADLHAHEAFRVQHPELAIGPDRDVLGVLRILRPLPLQSALRVTLRVVDVDVVV